MNGAELKSKDLSPSTDCSKAEKDLDVKCRDVAETLKDMKTALLETGYCKIDPKKEEEEKKD